MIKISKCKFFFEIIIILFFSQCKKNSKPPFYQYSVSFYTSCKENQDPIVQKDIEKLKTQFGSQDCMEVATNLHQQKELNLSHLSFSSLELLGGLSNLKSLSVNVEKIKDSQYLRPLSTLVSLESLTLKGKTDKPIFLNALQSLRKLEKIQPGEDTLIEKDPQYCPRHALSTGVETLCQPIAP